MLHQLSLSIDEERGGFSPNQGARNPMTRYHFAYFKFHVTIIGLIQCLKGKKFQTTHFLAHFNKKKSGIEIYFSL